MARIIGGSLIGFLSGKEAGRVFSHNKGGQYTRQYVIPTNANTAAQQRARSSFAAASSEFHNLTPAEKSAWNTFATTAFRPMHGATPGVTYSGQQAFQSLRRVARYMNEIFATATSRTLTVPAGAAATFSAFDETNTTPPTGILSADIQTSTGTPLPVRLGAQTNIYPNRNNDFEIYFGSGGSPAPQTNAPIFQDSNTSTAVGYAVMASKRGTEQAGMAMGPATRLVAAYQPLSIGTWSSSNRVKFETVADATEEAKYKEVFVPGDNVLLTLFAVSVAGQTQLIDVKEVTIP